MAEINGQFFRIFTCVGCWSIIPLIFFHYTGPGIAQDEEGREVTNVVELEELFPERASYRLAFDKILSEFDHVLGYEL